MSDVTSTNEFVIFSPEKQKELFDIIVNVFFEDLKTTNCFTLPVVGKRAGEAMCEKGFEKANKATFLASPDYFVLGYNEKNADAISLIGYPEDLNFSTSKNANYVPTSKQTPIQLTHAQQKGLAEIFVQTFKNYNKGEQVFLSTIGAKAGKKIADAGFGRVSIELFKRAIDYFEYSQDSKGYYLVSLKEDSDIQMPSLSKKVDDTQKKSLTKKTQKSFEERIFVQLKKNYKTNDISISNILAFLRNNKIVLPEQFLSFDDLVEFLAQKYGSIIRDNGEGTQKEQYIILRQTLPIPQNICERVELIIAEFFLNRDLIPNGDIGQALKSNNINYKDYNFCDLTSFLRSFSNIFTIVPQPSSNNRVQIFVRITPAFREKYANIELDHETHEQLLQSQFEKIVSDMFENGKYDSIIEQSVLREAIKHSNGDMWNYIIKSYLIVTGVEPKDVPQLTEWEKIAFNFEFLSENVSEEFLSSFSFEKEDIARIKQYISDYTHKTVNYSTLAQRIQSLCGRDSYLVDAILNLGLIARVQSDKSFCFRLLMLYYARTDGTKLRNLWLEHAETCINLSSMIMVVGTWFAEGYLDYIIEFTNLYNAINKPSEIVQLYYDYANILLEKNHEEMPHLSILENRRSVELVVALLEYAKKHNLSLLYSKMIYNCVNNASDYVSISSLYSILQLHSEYANSLYPELIREAEKHNHEMFVVLRQLISLGVITPDILWETLNNTLLEEYRNKIAECAIEEKATILYEAIDYFPTERTFVDELISIIKKSGSTESENLEGFIDNLIDSENYEQVTMLYEHDSSLEIRDKAWFLHKLSYCYQKKSEPKKSLDVEMAIISSMIKDGEEINDCLTQLIIFLCDGFISRSFISLDAATADRLLNLFKHYKCETINAHKYCIAMMGLALCAKNLPMLSMLFCLSNGYPEDIDFLEICKEEIQESPTGYSYRVGELQKTFEYILTQEKPEDALAILGKAANVIRTHQDEKIYFKFRDVGAEKIEPEKIITLIISEYNKERAWKLLSEYAHKSKKVALNFVANCIWFYKFKDTSYALSNCTNALERLVDNSLPRNFLLCCLPIWSTNAGRPVEGFKIAFIEHIRKCKSFQDADPELVEQWYNMLCTQKKPEQNEFLIATEIAKQSTTFGTFYKMFFEKESAYKAIMSRDVASFVRFCSAFLYSADDESLHEALNDIKELRNQIGSFNISKNDRSALMWIDDLMTNRNVYASDDYFVEASMAILASYPEAPSNDVVSKWITPDSYHRLPNYDLLRNWINTFGNMRVINTADYALRNYISKNYLSEDTEERERFFKIRFFLAEKYIVFFNRLQPNTHDDYFRRCKTYYGLRKLAKITTPIPADFKDKMHKDLEHFNCLDAYLNYEMGTDAFASAVDNDYIREQFIYCGITNFWDRVLEKCLECSEELIPYKDVIDDYFKVIDYRPIRRRLLQMYVFSSAGQIAVEENNELTVSIEELKDVRFYHNQIANGDIVFDDYITSVRQLIDILQPLLISVIEPLESAISNDERIKVIQNIIFVLSNKDLRYFRAKIETIDKDDFNSTILPTMIAIQNKNDISKMILQMSLNGEKYAEVMLNNELLSSVIGVYESNLFKAVLCVNCKDYEEASSFLSLAGSRRDTYSQLYDKLKEAITNKTDLDVTEDIGLSVSPKDVLPRFSFMKATTPSGMDLHQLVSDFYSESLHDAKGKCMIASKILALIEDGVSYHDTINLLFDWGFAEIEATYDIEKKAIILFEMLDDIDKLKDVKAFKERFVHNFIYLLQEFDFTILLKNFKRIFNCHAVLYSRFNPYDNCDCYVQALFILRDLYKLTNENVDPNAAMIEANKSKSNILELHMKYPQNRFATKCIDYVDRFIQQIFERGVFEVSILNIDNCFDGVVYYQVRNKGYELISNIALTFAIDGVPNTIEQVRIASLIPEGLRPNQVYAGEYYPGVDLEDGAEIGCSITVEYSVFGEDCQEIYKNYVAVDPNTDGKLIVSSNTNVVYEKDGSAGYSPESIKDASEFIGRKKELNEIMGKILKGRNVLLFGTNGTGKTSILHNIRKVRLPDAYNDETNGLGKHFSAALKFDDDCTEKNVFESIVNAVSGSTLFRVFVKRNGNDETQDILSLAAEEWASNVEKIFDENGVCTNTDAVQQYFLALDEALSFSNLDLYVLIDQFERVISSENINSRHMKFLSDLTCQRIRFVLAGSNYLLEEVSVDKINKKKDTSWREIFSRGFEKIKVGNMYREDFELLITQKSALNDGAIQYTSEALDYLWQFTKGHAFYSCLLGNRTLDIMSSRKVKRNVIYPSDIFIAIYLPGKYMPNEKSNNEKEVAIKDQIFQDIIDNVPIKFIGKSLAKIQSSGERKISYQKLKDYVVEHRPDITETDFADALSILVARDFISYDEIDMQHQTEHSHLDEIKIAREYYFTSDLYLEHFATVYVPELSSVEKKAIENTNQSIDELVMDLRTRKFSAEDITKVRDALKDFGSSGPTTVIHTDTVVGTNTGSLTSQKIENQNIVTINAQTINSAFTTLLTPGATEESFLKAFDSLPRLTSYIEKEQQRKLSEGSQALLADYTAYDNCFDADGRCIDEKQCEEIEKSIIVHEAELEDISAPAEQKLLSDTVGAVVNSDDFMTLSEQRWQELLGLKNIASVAKLKALPSEFVAPLTFAVVLHNVFDNVYKRTIEHSDNLTQELDYCPVAIMYCKIVEAMLKQGHTPMYIRSLGEKSLSGGQTTFADLGSPDDFDSANKELSIGSYVSHLVFLPKKKFQLDTAKEMPKPNDFRFTATFKDEIIDFNDNIRRLIDNQYIEEEMIPSWKSHARALKIIHVIRNSSAHEAAPITKKVFDWLIEVLFNQGELLKIWELTENS